MGGGDSLKYTVDVRHNYGGCMPQVHMNFHPCTTFMIHIFSATETLTRDLMRTKSRSTVGPVYSTCRIFSKL